MNATGVTFGIFDPCDSIIMAQPEGERTLLEVQTANRAELTRSTWLAGPLDIPLGPATISAVSPRAIPLSILNSKAMRRAVFQ